MTRTIIAGSSVAVGGGTAVGLLAATWHPALAIVVLVLGVVGAAAVGAVEVYRRPASAAEPTSSAPARSTPLAVVVSMPRWHRRAARARSGAPAEAVAEDAGDPVPAEPVGAVLPDIRLPRGA